MSSRLSDRLAYIAEALHLDHPNKETCVGVDRPTCGDVINCGTASS